MAKKILHGTEAQALLKRGVDAVADAVKITIGPRGRNVVFDKGYGAPMITNDGVSIAKEITLSSKFENMGAEIVKEVASKTNDAAGDGTTTSVVLAQAIIAEGFKRTGMGANGMVIRQGIEAAAADVVAALRSMAKPIKNKEEVKQVATISAENEEIGAIIAETIEKVGKDGVVTVEESQTFGVDSEVVEGMEFDKGYVSPYMITNPERMEAAYANVPVLVTDKKISAVKDILPLLEKLAAIGKKELVIIADDIEGEALPTFVVNKVRGIFNILAIKAPGYGDRKKEQLTDIAAVVGAKVVSEDLGQALETVDLNILGKAGKVISTKEKTTIVDGKGKKEEIKARVKALKSQLENTTMKYDREHLEKRIAKLASGVAVIKVGAATETEMKYLKLKIEDAVNATRAAIEEGIVPGGGVALVKVAKRLTTAAKGGTKIEQIEKEEGAEFAAGYKSLIAALSVPLKQIAMNARGDDGSVVVHTVAEKKGDESGYNAFTNEYADDMFEAGIIDPVKVTRTALQNAASAAGILLTTDVAIADDPEPKKEAPHMHGHGEMEY